MRNEKGCSLFVSPLSKTALEHLGTAPKCSTEGVGQKAVARFELCVVVTRSRSPYASLAGNLVQCVQVSRVGDGPQMFNRN